MENIPEQHTEIIEIDSNYLKENGFSVVDTDVNAVINIDNDSSNEKLVEVNKNVSKINNLAERENEKNKSEEDSPREENLNKNEDNNLHQPDNNPVLIDDSPISDVPSKCVNNDLQINRDLLEVKEDSLIISAEDDLDCPIEEKTEIVQPCSKSLSIKKESPMVPSKTNTISNETVTKKKSNTNILWVYNISRHVRACDLKKFFNQEGKVLTVKILTDGDNFFGYVVMESPDVAEKCLKHLNSTMFENKKISIRTEKPNNSNRNAPDVLKKSEKSGSRSSKVTKQDTNSKLNNVEEKTKRIDGRKKIERDWKREYNTVAMENSRLKRRVVEVQRLLTHSNSKLRNAEHEITKIKLQLQQERRKFYRDRDELEKLKKNEQIAIEADRILLSKDLDEIRGIREELRRKLDEIKNLPAANTSGTSNKQRKSSSNSPRRSQRNDSKKKWQIDHARQPPSPPKLSGMDSRKRLPENRHSYNDDKKSRRISPGRDRPRHSTGSGGAFFKDNAKPSEVSTANRTTNWNGGQYITDPWRFSGPINQQFGTERYCTYSMQTPHFVSNPREHHFIANQQEHPKHGYFEQTARKY